MPTNGSIYGHGCVSHNPCQHRGYLRTSLEGILDEIPDGIFVGAATNILLDFLGTNLEVHGQAL